MSIKEVKIIVERRPGHMEVAVQKYLDEGWSWNGNVMLSSTDGFVTYFTKGEEPKAPTRKKAVAKKATKEETTSVASTS